jgi:hypothetical protein
MQMSGIAVRMPLTGTQLAYEEGIQEPWRKASR